MIYSDERAETEFRNKSTAYAIGILHGGVLAGIFSTVVWGALLIYFLNEIGFFSA